MKNLEKIQPKDENILLYISFNSPSYLKLFNQLITDLTKQKNNVFVLNPPSYTEIQIGLGKFLVKLFRLVSPYRSWLNEINENDKVVIYDYKDFLTSQNDLFLELKWNELTKSEEFLRSLRSTLISEFRSSNPELEFRYIEKRKDVINLAKRIFIQTSNILKVNSSITQLLVPNGRFLDQFVFSQMPRILDKNHIKIFFYERGFKPDSYYAGETSLLDRVKMQELISNQEAGSAVLDWFANRIIDPSANEYSGLWNKTELNAKVGSSAKTTGMTIFSSSPDEFAFLGPDWHESEWTDQWEAYNAVIRRFSNTYNITIRLHPNTINKSRMERKRTRKSVKNLKRIFPEVRVISASSSINSYSLIRESAIVVVWYSTIGLEAVSMEVPVICLNSSEWDLIVDVNKVFSANFLEAIQVPLQTPNKSTATKFILGRIALDHPINAAKDQKISGRIRRFHYSLNQKISENMRSAIYLQPRHILIALYQCGFWTLSVKFVPRSTKNSIKIIHRVDKARFIESVISKS
jgi:hypothetical protein